MKRLVLLSALVGAAGCGSEEPDSRALIIGKWRQVYDNNTLHIEKDKVTFGSLEDSSKSHVSSYTFIDDKTIELESPRDNKKMPFDVLVTKEYLVLTPQGEDESVKLKRVDDLSKETKYDKPRMVFKEVGKAISGGSPPDEEPKEEGQE